MAGAYFDQRVFVPENVEWFEELLDAGEPLDFDLAAASLPRLPPLTRAQVLVAASMPQAACTSLPPE